MNRNLVVFSLLLIFIGFALGFYLITLFGLFILIPSLLSPTRIPTRPAPAPTPPQPPPRRIAPPAFKQPETTMQPNAAATEMAHSYMAVSSSEQQPTFYAPALFPTPMFPSLFGMTTAQAPTTPMKESEHKKPQEQDELIEVGALLALLKLAFG